MIGVLLVTHNGLGDSLLDCVLHVTGSIPPHVKSLSVMADDDPLGWFITWTVYGTHLQGADLGWRKLGEGQKPPQSFLNVWHSDRLNHPVIVLDPTQRNVVEAEVTRHCLHRGWKLWTCNPRSTHVHVVVTAMNVSGKIVRDQLKANGTRGLREKWNVFRDRPVWTQAGDWQGLNTEEALQRAIEYVRGAQDRK